MRVAIFCESRIWGGLEVHAVALSGVLADAGHEVSVVCVGAKTRRLYEGRLPAGVVLVEIPEPASRALWSWLRALRTIRADAAVLEKGTIWTGGLGLDWALRLRYGAYVAIQQLEPPPLPPKASRPYLAGLVRGPGFWWLRWKWLGHARSLAPLATVCVSEAVRQRLMTQYAFSAGRLITIRNGVDLSVFKPDAAERAEVRREWGVPDDAFVFGLVSRLVHHKGLDVAVEAFGRLVGAQPDRRMFLIVAGEGVEKPALEARVARLGLHDHVRFLGLVAAPHRCYQAIDAYVMPSRSEALGIALIEAMASGCQVIGTDVGGIPEIITDPSVGTLVRPEDPADLADAMTRAVLRDDGSRMAAAHAARDYVHRHFDVRTQCARITDLLGDLRGSRAS
jgi:glycosyltransferase involved in cell wall biosynthesis